ncbi:hypothetical protein KGF56_000722 [Candida oxycetoniae]|uniref:amidase n=1 Tax=Candida oxycetoniae TaxID=497107 RepID=A0AAI9T195_9ASCO|nr:uncharacterized protein KGF56_000722 [Candida oxycetoniae]KAI3406590.1 hypothetical protein KGF56_000722 [Candida oxycetoniae]
MSKTVTFEQFLTKDPLDNYGDIELYKSKYLPLIKKYNQRLEENILDEYKIDLPKPRDELIAEQFDAVDYLYKAKLLTEREFEITDSSATKIVSEIANGNWTCAEVFTAFAKRATIAHQFTNCAHELFTKEGLERAKELDEYYKANGKTVGPLHGLPISLKEFISLKGKVTHGGYAAFVENIAEDDSVTAKILKDAGAVYYIRTTQPLTLMQLDSENNYSGFTKNPFNLLLSSGGSSSGEGAVVSFGGSTLGVGSDIGGSIRSPAGFSGCHGFRPTTRRISNFGNVANYTGQESVSPVTGPLGRSVSDIELFMKTYINEGKPWNYDTWSIPMLWRDVPKPKADQLTIGVVRDDGFVRPSPPIRRGIDVVVSKLEAAGVKVVPFVQKNAKLAYETVHKMYTCDGNDESRSLIAKSGEPIPKLTKWSLNYGDGARVYTAAENRHLNTIRDDLREEYNKFFMDNKVDFILSPLYNNVAPHSGEVYNWSYTSIFNILDLPTLAFQTGLRQDPELDVWTEEDKKHVYRSDLEQLENENYKPDEFKGAPIALQLSGRRYFDEEVLASARLIIDDILKVDLFKH